MSGQKSEEMVDEFKPVHLLSKPGELRKEYEEEVSKMEAERRAIEENEEKMSKEYIQRLLAEEEEEEARQSRKRQRELEEQLKSDEELARKLSFNLNYCDRKDLASPLNSTKPGTVTAKSPKKSKKRNTNTGDTQTYFSPKFQFGSTSQPEVAQESRNVSMSKETDTTVVKSPVWQDTVIEEDMPTVFPQLSMDIQEQAAQSSVESPVPQLHDNGREWCLQQKIKMTRSNRDKELRVLNNKGPEARVPCFGETESACTVSGMTQIIESNKVDTEDEDDCILISEDISKGKNQESSFEAVMDPCISAKRKKMFPKASSAPEETEINVTENVIDLECLPSERNKQEEQDWFFAYQLQQEIDKEQMKPNRQKGSPDEYQLRPVSSRPDKL